MGVRLKALVVFGLFLHVGGVTSEAGAEQVQGTTEATSNQHGCPQVSAPLPISFRACYVHESKVLPLLAQISAVLKMFNSKEDHAESLRVRLQAPAELDEHKKCSKEEIQGLIKELVWITRRLWTLSNRLEQPVDAQVALLKKRGIDLVHHLHNLVVYTGDSPASLMKLASFNTQVDLLDTGFNKALAAFELQRPVRSNVTMESIIASIKSRPGPRTGSRSKRRQSTILDPSNTIAELVQLAERYPEDMSEALPQLVSDRYGGKIENAKLVLDLIKQLPNVVHQMIGYASLYDAMSANSDLESYELTELASQLAGISDSVASASDGIPPPVLTRYTQLVDNVWPVYQFYHLIETKENMTCFFQNLKYSQDLDVNSGVVDVSSWSFRIRWTVKLIPQTAMFNILGLKSSESFYTPASAKRIVSNEHDYSNGPYSQWKWIPVQSGKHFRILNAKYDEVLFADNSLMNPGRSTSRLVFLAKHDSPNAHDYLPNADLWTIECE